MIAALLLVTASLATPGFPAGIASHLSAPCEPPCAVCHVGTQDASTATTDLAVALLDRGLVGYDDVALGAALDQLEADGIDADGDGVPDTEELAAGYDPNPGGAAFCDVLQPTWGCFNHAGGMAPASLGTGLALLAVLRRRERR